MTELLTTEGLTVRFGGLVAVDDVSFDVRKGELVGLIGPNGAGKTTFINAVTGFVPSSGRISFDGQDITGLAPHRIAHLGLSRTWQTLELFEDVSVRANVDVAATRLTLRAAIADLFSRRREVDARVDDVIGMLGLDDVADRDPSELSQGHRKLIGVARALVGGARLLLIDEPAAGLDRSETEWFGHRLREIQASGVTILIVDHDMGLVLSVCDRIQVLEFGKLIATGTPSEIRNDPTVIAAYLGSTPDQEGAR